MKVKRKRAPTAEEAYRDASDQQWVREVWGASFYERRDEQARWESFFVAALASGAGRFPDTKVEAAQDIADESMKLVKLRERVKWEECLAEARKARRKK